MNTRLLAAAVVLASGVTLSGPVLAHHSFTMFDVRPEAELVLVGVIKQWAFVNPHSWLTVTVTDADGTQTDWSLEAAAVAQLVPKGITVETYKVGEKVTVVVGPMKDGRHAGILKFVLHSNGTYTLPNDAGNIGQDALDRWKAKQAKAEPAPAAVR